MLVRSFEFSLEEPAFKFIYELRETAIPSRMRPKYLVYLYDDEMTAVHGGVGRLYYTFDRYEDEIRCSKSL